MRAPGPVPVHSYKGPGVDCLSCAELAYRRYSPHGHLLILFGTVLFALKTPKFIHNSFLYNAVTSVMRTPGSTPLISVFRRCYCVYFYFIYFTENVHDEEDLQQEPTQSVVRIATWFHVLRGSLASLISLRLKSFVNFPANVNITVGNVNRRSHFIFSIYRVRMSCFQFRHQST